MWARFLPAGSSLIEIKGKLARFLCRRSVAVSIVFALFTLGGYPVDAAKSQPWSKLLLTATAGWHVSASSGYEQCVTAKEVCKPGMQSSNAGGYRYLGSVAVDPRTGYVYVGDSGNSRVVEMAPSGEFVAMFGWDVNATSDGDRGASRAQRNVCTASSGDRCTAGVRGYLPGHLSYPASVAVDPHTGNVYVAEINLGHDSIDKYTSSGHFIWRIGGRANLVTGGYVCRAIKDHLPQCGSGNERRQGDFKRGTFRMIPFHGNLLAVGGPEDLLYVGDEGRIQEFTSDGSWRREFGVPSLTPASLAGIAIDQAGNVYVLTMTDLVANTLREYDVYGNLLHEFVVKAREELATVTMHGLATDGMNHLAVIGGEEGLTAAGKGSYDETYRLLGAVLDGSSGKRLSEFYVPIGNDGLAFSATGELFVAATDGQEVLTYAPSPVSGLMTGPLNCFGAGEDEASVTFRCRSSP